MKNNNKPNPQLTLYGHGGCIIFGGMLHGRSPLNIRYQTSDIGRRNENRKWKNENQFDWIYNI